MFCPTVLFGLTGRFEWGGLLDHENVGKSLAPLRREIRVRLLPVAVGVVESLTRLGIFVTVRSACPP